MILAHLARRCGALSVHQTKIEGVEGGHDVIGNNRVNRPYGTLIEHEDGGIDTRLAQLNALVDRRDGELVGPRLQHGLRASHRAVAIRIGLDRAHELHVSAKALL